MMHQAGADAPARSPGRGEEGIHGGAAMSGAAGERVFLRHVLATLAYRGGKAIRDAPDGFADFRVGETTRTPLEILGHLGDLLAWALALARGVRSGADTVPTDWDTEVGRFFEGLALLDACLASDDTLGCDADRLFQGPLADALTHVGQLALLRRLAGSPVRGENYYRAVIEGGRVGPEQAAPVREFD